MKTIIYVVVFTCVLHTYARADRFERDQAIPAKPSRCAIAVPSTPVGCPKYAPQDRAKLNDLLLTFTYHLTRMGNLAFLGAFSYPQVQLNLTTERPMMEEEYQVLINEIAFIETALFIGFRPETVTFVRKIVNLDNLRLRDTTLLGASDYEARVNSQKASTALNVAVPKIWGCF